MNELRNYRFQTNLGFQKDYWGLCGQSEFDPEREVFVPAPLAFDRASATIRTVQGEFRLVAPQGDQEKIFCEIEKVVAKGGYECW